MGMSSLRAQNTLRCARFPTSMRLLGPEFIQVLRPQRVYLRRSHCSATVDRYRVCMLKRLVRLVPERSPQGGGESDISWLDRTSEARINTKSYNQCCGSEELW
jgi:hypothetical protein